MAKNTPLQSKLFEAAEVACDLICLCLDFDEFAVEWCETRAEGDVLNLPPQRRPGSTIEVETSDSTNKRPRRAPPIFSPRDYELWSEVFPTLQQIWAKCMECGRIIDNTPEVLEAFRLANPFPASVNKSGHAWQHPSHFEAIHTLGLICCEELSIADPTMQRSSPLVDTYDTTFPFSPESLQAKLPEIFRAHVRLLGLPATVDQLRENWESPRLAMIKEAQRATQAIPPFAREYRFRLYRKYSEPIDEREEEPSQSDGGDSSQELSASEPGKSVPYKGRYKPPMCKECGIRFKVSGTRAAIRYLKCDGCGDKQKAYIDDC